MSEWIKYTGSDEQIAEIVASRNGVKLRYVNGNESSLIIRPATEWQDHSHVQDCIKDNLIDYYLICNPHPLEDMICQQARTGQPVYVLEPILVSNPTADTDFSIHETYSKKGKFFIRKDGYWLSYDTDKPNWYIPGAQYRLTPFEE